MDTVDGLAVRIGSQDTTGPTGAPVDRTNDSPAMADRCDEIWMEPTQTGPLVDSSDSAGGGPMEDDVLQISGAGHWFLDGWIGDHAVEFLVDSGSSVTAMSDSMYQSLVRAGAPVGTLGCISRTSHVANGTGIVVSGCSHCVISFMGLLIAIIGTDVLGSVLPHTLDMKNGLLFTEGARRCSYTTGMTHFLVTFSQLDTALFLLTRRLYCIVL